MEALKCLATVYFWWKALLRFFRELGLIGYSENQNLLFYYSLWGSTWIRLAFYGATWDLWDYCSSWLMSGRREFSFIVGHPDGYLIYLRIKTWRTLLIIFFYGLFDETSGPFFFFDWCRGVLHRSISLMVTILTELISLVMSHFFSHFKELSLFGLCPVRVFLIHMYLPSDILMYFYVKLIYIFSVYSGFLLSHTNALF